ncbi:BTAD domain-containing putative transcriptional regulator [Actinophytocola oryzae]|uniref:DNA-binding SARP family transcriptional activator n=1 Tax=Actinophytocola oryzae TaxID=502181 RepID=A0A4R7VZN0_9PSEU|nr:BTAD domain-containing putative transcriptional regulator [Actinophytocola oryzae]TDV55128.1 DNA-binding SARP family transcriptional activator [Actinophytocola oryzae]
MNDNAVLGILGTTALLLDSGPDDSWGKPRERAVLAALLVHANELVPVDTLVRWVWPTDKPAPLPAGPTIDSYVVRIRRVLGRMPGSPRVQAEAEGYRLVVDTSLVDLYQFRGLLGAAQAEQSPSRAIELVEAALWLWRGLPLADLVTPPARTWREQVVREDWLAAHTVRVQAFLRLGRYDAMLAALDELQLDFPDDVSLAKLRLTALYHRRLFADANRYFLATWHRLRGMGDQASALLLREHDSELAAAHPVPVLPEPTVVPRQLPDDVTDFVGRREELALLDAVGDSGVLVLDGPGGVGKTALAVHWAHRVRGRFSDGEIWVNMRGFTAGSQVDVAAVVDDLLAALGQPPAANLGRRQREQLLKVLVADRQLLVVLDNVRDADPVRRLIELMPSCLVVVTSRRRLSLPVVARVSLRPLTPESATILLSVRAHGRIPDAGRISAFCGGLPLLLTVLAGQLVGKSPANLGELVTRLDRRRVFAAAGKDVPTPNGESCLTWAYQALAAPERRLFRLLAVHPGDDIAAEAAYACDGRSPAETVASLMCLVAANLLEPSDELDRFGRHDVLGEFATRCLESDEPADEVHAARERLFDYYVTSTTSAASLACQDHLLVHEEFVPFGDADEALTWFGRERHTLSAILRQAYDAAWHDHVGRLADPVASLLERAGNTVESRAVRLLALDSARAAGEREVEVTALCRLGATHLLLDEHEAARRCLAAAARMAPADDLRCGHVSLFDQLGQLAMFRGERAEALSLYERALTVAEQADDLAGMCWLYCRIGQVLRVAQHLDDALGQLRQARAVARLADDRAAEALALAEIGAIHRDLGECSAALAYCEEALAIAESIPDLTSAALICATLSTIGSESRWFDKAVAYSRRGVELLRGSQDLSAQAQVVAAHGDALYHSGEPDEAVLMWQQAADLYDHAGFGVLAMRLRSKMESRRMHGSAPRARVESPSAIRHIVNSTE